MSKMLSSTDYDRIEAALNSVLEEFRVLRDRDRSSVHPDAIASYERTLENVQRINRTGKYTPSPYERWT